MCFVATAVANSVTTRKDNNFCTIINDFMRNLIIVLFALVAMPWWANATDSENVAEPRRKRVVVLDPGHGGPRPGKVVGSVHEADLVLEVALEARRQLATRMPDLEVYLTRYSDSAFHATQSTDNRMRAEYANRLGADLTLGIHANAGAASANGCEVWVLSLDSALMRQNQRVGDMYADEGDFISAEELDPTSISYMMALSRQLDNDPRNRNFARVCCDNLSALGLRNRGTKSGVVYTLLYYLEGPGALIELGFLSNTNDRNYMTSSRGKREMATAIADAVVYFIEGLDAAAGYVGDSGSESVADASDDSSSGDSSDALMSAGYSIQLISSTTEVDINDYQFRGYRGRVHLLMGTGRWKYKYCYGRYATAEEAQADLAEARATFRDAYVVRYEGNNIR